MAVQSARIFATLLQTVPPAATLATFALAAGPLDEVALPLYLTLPLMAEAAHYVVSAASSRAFSGKAADTLPERDAREMVALWRQCLADPTTTVEEFITGWFAPTDRRATPTDGVAITVGLEELQRDNVEDWLSYALFATQTARVDAEQRRRLDEAIVLLEASLSDERWRRWKRGRPLLGRRGRRTASVDELMAEAPPREFRFPPGFNRALRSYRLNVDPPAVNTMPRPLFYYGLTDGLLCGIVTPAVMRQRGFTLHTEGRLTYWFHAGDAADHAADAAVAASSAAAAAAAASSNGRPPPKELLERGRSRRTSDGAALAPVVFVHGVGLGPLPYFGLIDEMLTNADGAPMLVIELPFVSQRISGFKHAPQEERTSLEIAGAMAKHGIESATFVGHSLGTVYLTWLVRKQPQLLASCVFIDPIVFLLHQHKVAQSFLYSRPDKANLKGNVERYFIKSEHSIVTFFHRHFYWFANILWAHELHAPSAVILADNDGIVPVREVERYLASEGRGAVRKVLTLKGQTHGSFLVDAEARRVVLDTVRDAQAWGAAFARRRIDVRRMWRAFLSVVRRMCWWRSPTLEAAARRVGAPGWLHGRSRLWRRRSTSTTAPRAAEAASGPESQCDRVPALI